MKKNSIYDSMLGGEFGKDPNRKKDQVPETFSIMYQFSDEEPVPFYTNINVQDDFIMTMKCPSMNQEKSDYLEFKSKSGQTLKIYGIKNKI